MEVLLACMPLPLKFQSQGAGVDEMDGKTRDDDEEAGGQEGEHEVAGDEGESSERNQWQAAWHRRLLRMDSSMEFEQNAVVTGILLSDRQMSSSGPPPSSPSSPRVPHQSSPRAQPPSAIAPPQPLSPTEQGFRSRASPSISPPSISPRTAKALAELRRRREESEALWREKRQYDWCSAHTKVPPCRTIVTYERREALRRAFDALDANGNGKLDMDELRDPLQKIGVGARDLKALIKAINERSRDKRLTFDGFCVLILGANTRARLREQQQQKRRRVEEQLQSLSFESHCVDERSHELETPERVEPLTALTDPERFPFSIAVDSERISRMVDDVLRPRPGHHSPLLRQRTSPRKRPTMSLLPTLSTRSAR